MTCQWLAKNSVKLRKEFLVRANNILPNLAPPLQLFTHSVPVIKPQKLTATSTYSQLQDLRAKKWPSQKSLFDAVFFFLLADLSVFSAIPITTRTRRLTAMVSNGHRLGERGHWRVYVSCLCLNTHLNPTYYRLTPRLDDPYFLYPFSHIFSSDGMLDMHWSVR